MQFRLLLIHSFLLYSPKKHRQSIWQINDRQHILQEKGMKQSGGSLSLKRYTNLYSLEDILIPKSLKVFLAVLYDYPGMFDDIFKEQ